MKTDTPIRPPAGQVRWFGIAMLAWALFLCPGCGTHDDKTVVSSKPRVEQMSSGPIEVTITADPGTVRLDRDVMLSIRVSHPSDIAVTMPQIGDRLTGFVLRGVLGAEPVESEGTTTVGQRFRLSPIVADEYRLGPMAVVYNKKRGISDEKWFATRPIVFEFISPVQGDPGDDISVEMRPVWIRPSLRTLVLYCLLAVAVIVALVILIRLIAGLHREQRLRRMSPRERALMELAELLRKNLVGKKRVKEFYLKLTMIVRRYIERRHSVRAPEQTTEEFLTTVSNDVRFAGDVVKKLKAFLEAADLVKFAGHRPEADDIERATSAARDYIESDSPQGPDGLTKNSDS